MTRPRALVFGYHEVGVRCLSVLISRGIDVSLVVSHEDAAGENIWFGSVAALCARAQIACITPDRPDLADIMARLPEGGVDFVFSFYYRQMLPEALLQLGRRGAFNMHGSLLPHYRGRVPVNWAVLRGERHAGATLHAMVARADAGDIVDQQAVPILDNDTAQEVFGKVSVAAEMVLERSLGGLVDGSAVLRPQDLAAGSYFSGRKPADGLLDLRADAWAIHNLVRAVAPPYPGAFFPLAGGELRILRTWWPALPPETASSSAVGVALLAREGKLWLRCVDGTRLEILEAELDGAPLDASRLCNRFESPTVPLTESLT
jgi:methionyl-tRNA formyltransferase